MALDTLITHPAPERIQKSQSHSMLYAALVLVVLLVVGYVARGPAAVEAGLLKNADQDEIRLLVLGGSIAETRDCPTCATYIEQFAAAAARDEGGSVQIFGAGGDPTTWPLTDLAAVTALLQDDDQLRELVRSADIVLISLGGGPPAGAFDTGSCAVHDITGRACPTSRRGLRSQRDSLRTTIDDLRRPDSTVLLLVT